MNILGLFIGDGDSAMVAMLVFLAAGTLAFSIMAVIRVQVRSSAARRTLAGSMASTGRVVRARCGIQA